MGTELALKPGLLLDTHTWIWLRSGALTATPDILAAIRHAALDDNWFLCAFSLYEIAYAVGRKRLQLDRPLLDWLHGASGRGMPTILEITPSIAAATLTLPDSFHGDPGDRIIAATAIAHGLTICTHDKELLRHSKQGLYRAMKVDELKEKNV